jgi:hypothetical protein
MDSLVLQTAIGLVFIFATVAALVSVVTESISRYVGLRAEYLMRGLRMLLDGGGEFKLPFLEAVFGFVFSTRKKMAAATTAPAAATATVHAATAAHAAAKVGIDSADKALAAAKRGRDENRIQTAEAAFAQAEKAFVDAEQALATVQSAALSATEAAQDRAPAVVARIMAHPLIGSTANLKVAAERRRFLRKRPKVNVAVPAAPAGDAPLTNKQRRQLPSYISARSFAQAVIDVIVPNSADATTMTQIRDGIARIPSGDIPDHLRTALLAMANTATANVETFRTNIEHWYDDQMARVSGWYKRHVRWVSAGIGLTLVIALNLNVLTIARSLYSDEAVRGSVVTQATGASRCTKSPADCLQDLRTQISTIRGSGVPIGWAKAPACASTNCSWAEQWGFWRPHEPHFWRGASDLGIFLLGWVLMVIALLPGGRFWFDLLGRLGSLRSTGPKPATT